MVVSSLVKKISLRSRLMILLAMAFVPLAALVGVLLVSEHRMALDVARSHVQRLAEIASAEHSAFFSQTRVFLDTLRRIPGIDADGGPNCARIVTEMKAANLQYHTIGVADLGQMVTCHNTLRVVQRFGAPDQIAAMQRPEAPEFNVGEFVIGKVSGKPTVIAGMKLLPENGVSRGTVFVSMNLEFMADIARRVSVDGQYSVVMIETRSARLLTRYPALPVPFGTPFEGHPLVEAMLATDSVGYANVPGLDGIESIQGFARLHDAGDANVGIAVGISRDAVLAKVRQHIVAALAAGSTILVLAFGGTWALGYWTQLRPINHLTRTAERIGSGQLDTRTQIEPWQAPELRILASALDTMSAKLEEGRRAEEAVAASESRFRLLAENSADLVTSLDAGGRRVFVSPASRELFGMEPESLMAGHPCDIAHPDDRPIVDAMMEKLASGEVVAGVQYRAIHRDGHALWVEVSGKPLKDGTGTVLVIRDISRRKQAEQRLSIANETLAGLANTDGLTGIGNRRSFDRRLKTAFDRCVAERSDLSLVLLDVDWFKRFNDTYGHLAGDECLRQIATVLGDAVRDPGDHAARFGGEELALILPGTSVGDAIERGESVRQAVERLALPNAGSDFGHVTVSIGVVSLHGGWGFDSPDDMLRSADQALYEVKANGRNALRYAMSLAVKGKNRVARTGMAISS